MHSIRQLSDHELAAKLHQLNQQKQTLDADLLIYLSELERRRLYREHACSSLFEFCLTALGYSEDVAYKRVGAARLLQQYPEIYDLLADGRIHLTGLMLLKPHLNATNYQDWLLCACGKSKRQIEKLIATRCPRPNVPTSIRKVPGAEVPLAIANDPSSAAKQADPPPASLREATVASPPDTSTQTSATAQSAASQHEQAKPEQAKPAAAQSSAPNVAAAARIAPLSSNTYRVVFTASERLKQKLDRARELLSHAIPPNDLPAVIERALDQLIEREEQRRYAAHARRSASSCSVDVKREPLEPESVDCARHAPCQKPSPTPAEPQDPDPNHPKEVRPRSRYVPAAVRREVWKRDAGQCTFLDRTGRRCEQRHFLEFDHCEAFAIGGQETVDNLRLRCKAHNALEAERLFGPRRIASAIAHAQRVSAR